MSPKGQTNLVLRAVAPEDSPVCGQICYDAFSRISEAHGFPCDFPGPDVATGVLSMMFSTSGFYCVVAEHEGRIVRQQLPRRAFRNIRCRPNHH